MRPSTELELPTVLRKLIADKEQSIRHLREHGLPTIHLMISGNFPEDGRILSKIRKVLKVPKPAEGETDALARAYAHDKKLNEEWGTLHGAKQDEAAVRQFQNLYSKALDRWCEGGDNRNYEAFAEQNGLKYTTVKSWRTRALPGTLHDALKVVKLLAKDGAETQQMMDTYYRARHLNRGHYETREQVIADLDAITDPSILLARCRLAAGMELAELAELSGVNLMTLNAYENTSTKWHAHAEDFARILLPPRARAVFVAAARRTQGIGEYAEIWSDAENNKDFSEFVTQVARRAGVTQEELEEAVSGYRYKKPVPDEGVVKKMAAYMLPAGERDTFIACAESFRNAELAEGKRNAKAREAEEREEKRWQKAVMPGRLDAIFNDMSVFNTFGEFAAAVRGVRQLNKTEAAARMGKYKNSLLHLESRTHIETPQALSDWMKAMKLTPFQQEKTRDANESWRRAAKTQPAMDDIKGKDCETLPKSLRKYMQLHKDMTPEALAEKANLDAEDVRAVIEGKESVPGPAFAANIVVSLAFPTVRAFNKAMRETKAPEKTTYR